MNLPYRDCGTATTYSRESGGISLRLRSGEVRLADGSFEPIGLPYGAKARLIMLHLCNLAVKSQSPTVEVQNSFTAFADSLGINVNGRSLKRLSDQVNRLSAVHMRLDVLTNNINTTFKGDVFSQLLAQMPTSPNQRVLFPSIVTFTGDFYSSLIEHAVPLRLDAISALKHSSRCLDIYTWLAWRLRMIPRNRTVTIKWTSLRWQFGEKHIQMRGFKKNFVTALNQVLSVYPDANVEVIYGGIALKKSLPPIPSKDRALLL